MDSMQMLIDMFMKSEGEELKRPSIFMEAFYADVLAAGFQRHYVQAGPWAEMLREG